MKIIGRLTVILLVLVALLPVYAQVTTGNIRGIVRDPNGAAVPGAKVTLIKEATSTLQTTQSGDSGEYNFNNLLVGVYTLQIEAPNFNNMMINDVTVQLNSTTDVPVQLQVAGVSGGTVEVTAAGAELVDTTTTNLSKQFSARQVADLAQSTTGLGVYNLALISPNVSSSGGVGAGSGGSIGGQRPRNNNFIVDGIDNNDKGVTGPQVYISPDTVSEFSLLTNQYSAEFARSTGGQFVLTTKSGTNDFHGTGYAFFRNRYLNAIDTLNKQPGASFTRDQDEVNPDAGVSFIPRSDYSRYGFNIGGPLYLPRFGEGGPSFLSGKDRLFFFTSYEGLQTGGSQPGDAGGASVFDAPTAEGMQLLSNMAGVSQQNLALFTQFVPTATTQTGSISVGGVSIPVGTVTIPAPQFFNRRNFVLNIDFNQSEKTQHRGRFIYNRERAIDTAAVLPTFFDLAPLDQRLFSYTLFHSLSPTLTNETRLAYRRSVQAFPVPDIAFPLPGFDSFPNVGIGELSLDIGPDPNAPQSATENNYQVVNNVTYLRGNHSFKFGGDFRKLIAPQIFVQRQRGDYQYNTLQQFLFDITPDFLSQRNVGANTYYGDQRLLFAFAQDDWRIRPNLTLNLGVNYAYQEVPFGATQQSLNSIASVPGLIEFGEPEAQKKNFAPRIGFAYSPDFDSGLLGRLFGSGGKTSIRAGFSMAYDVIFDNLYLLSSPPQFQQTIDTTDTPVQNFLANGGIPNIIIPTANDSVAARAATSTFVPDQQVPYSITYTASIQRQFAKDFSVEVRYLGTRGVHLLTQNLINVQSPVSNTPGNFLPTFSSAPSQAEIDSLTTTLGDLTGRGNILPQYAAAGFTSPITAFLSNGNSTYHGGSVQVQRRLSNGLQFSGAYTYSHLIDDTTAEVFSTVLSPRRVEDFQNLTPEKADSALDRRHRFVFSSLYELPFFRTSDNAFLRRALGGFNLTGTLTFESGEKYTVLSGIDSNLNGDTAGDRAIFNPNGVENSISTVTPLLRTCTAFNANGTCAQSANSRTVGYVANDPNAQYIQAGLGAVSTSGRNTVLLPGINNLDFSVYKDFNVFGEGRSLQFRVDFFNAFNHPQFTPGSVNGGVRWS